MPDLSTRYMGLNLENPVIVGSCGLTDSVKSIKELEKNGADAIELNLYLSPFDIDKKSDEIEDHYFSIIHDVTKRVSIPVGIKTSQHFTNPGRMIKKLSETNISGIALFNRFFNPDFDINSLETTTTNVFSKSSDQSIPLRWIALLSGSISCDLAATTGIHDGTALIKQLLAGAKAVEIASTLYTNGPEQIDLMLNDLKKWMDEKGFNSLKDFRGKMSRKSSSDPTVYKRVQFMKFFSGKF